MGYPVLIAEDMPDVAADAMPVAFGDFNAATPWPSALICAFCVTRSAPSRMCLFYATKRVGGDVSDFAAIKLLKFGTRKRGRAGAGLPASGARRVKPSVV